jgi:anaerobic selenocysteine-containing dehydrogenase
MGLGSGTDALIDRIEAGTVKAALIVGEDPLAGASDPERLREALGRLEFLAVADVALTGTGALAHTVFPLAAPSETAGTFTSSERRVQSVRTHVPGPGGISNYELISALSAELGPSDLPTDEAAIREELRDALDLPDFPGSEVHPNGVRWGEGGAFELGREVPGGVIDLTPPPADVPDRLFDPRWTDHLDTELSRRAEELGLRPHVVRRRPVSA